MCQYCEISIIMKWCLMKFGEKVLGKFNNVLLFQKWVVSNLSQIFFENYFLIGLSKILVFYELDILVVK